MHPAFDMSTAPPTPPTETPQAVEPPQPQPNDFPPNNDELSTAPSSTPNVQEAPTPAPVQQPSPSNGEANGDGEGHLSRASTMFDPATNTSKPKPIKVDVLSSAPFPILRFFVVCRGMPASREPCPLSLHSDGRAQSKGSSCFLPVHFLIWILLEPPCLLVIGPRLIFFLPPPLSSVAIHAYWSSSIRSTWATCPATLAKKT